MKFTRILIPALALGVLASFTSLQAQEAKKGRGMSPEQRIARIEENVGTLTADQKAKITSILADSQQQLAGIPKEERREKGRELQKQTNEKIRAVLTPEQQKKFDAMPQQGPGGKKKSE